MPPIPSFDPVEHKYTHEGRDYVSVTQVLEGLKLTPEYPPDRGQKDFGTAAHKAAELALWEKLDWDRTSPVLVQYLNGLMEKVEEMKIRPIYTELRGVHLGEQFAGTMDLVCSIFDTDIAVIDFKTGSSVPRCAELQTAGYGELALFMEGMRSQPLFTRAKMPRRFSMQLLPDRAVVREHKDAYDYHAWIAAVRLYRWLSERRNGNGVA